MDCFGVHLAASAAGDDVDHRDDDRAALGVLEQIVRDVVLELGLEAVQVDALEALLDCPLQLSAQAVHDLFVVAHVDEAAADDIRAGQQVAGLLVDGQHDGHQAFFAQQDAVLDDHVADDGAGLVDQDGAVRHFAGHFHLVGRQAMTWPLSAFTRVGARDALLDRQVDVALLDACKHRRSG